MTVVSVFLSCTYHYIIVNKMPQYGRILRGDRGSSFPLKNHKNKGFLSNTGPDRLKKTKLQSQHTLLGHLWHASETPFKLSYAGGPMMPTYSGICWYPLPSKKRTLSKLDPLWQTFLDPRMSLIRYLLLLAHILSLITCNLFIY